MGGHAFASGPSPMFTPRMPPSVYETVKRSCHAILSQHYTYVATPIEAPGKKDYGDVDFLVACPLGLCQEPEKVVEALSVAVGAERSISGKGSSTVSLAIPWPTDLVCEKTMNGDFVATPHESSTLKGNDIKHVQVDINICSTWRSWSWMLFQHAHGDLWNILGSTIRRLGLTVNTSGLYLRIEEIEAIDKKKSLVLLTSSPSEVLKFLGLDEDQWNRRFESAQAMYDYAAGCRYFWASADEDEGLHDVEEDKAVLKHNDRKRMSMRPVFRGWVEDFVPLCRAAGTYRRSAASREEVRSDAFAYFDSGVKEEYESRLEAWRRERQADFLWRSVIKAGVPMVEGENEELRAAAIRGLKAIIIEGDIGETSGTKPAKALKSLDGYYDADAVAEFVKENWLQVGEAQLARQRIRAMEKIEENRMVMNLM